MKAIAILAALAGLVWATGCEPAPIAPALAPQPTTTTDPTTDEASSMPFEANADSGDADNASDPTGTQGDTERKVAAVGDDRRGRNYGGGVITEPIRQYFRVGQQIQLMNLKRAMDLYKAGHDNKLPATHEDFMKDIVKANSIELPELPAGERYLFDPKVGELMVERPKQ